MKPQKLTFWTSVLHRSCMELSQVYVPVFLKLKTLSRNWHFAGRQSKSRQSLRQTVVAFVSVNTSSVWSTRSIALLVTVKWKYLKMFFHRKICRIRPYSVLYISAWYGNLHCVAWPSLCRLYGTIHCTLHNFGMVHICILHWSTDDGDWPSLDRETVDQNTRGRWRRK